MDVELWVVPSLALQRPEIDARRRRWYPGHNLLEEASQLVYLGVLVRLAHFEAPGVIVT